jgi:outer membrane receptor protein involved in Fe transport
MKLLFASRLRSGVTAVALITGFAPVNRAAAPTAGEITLLERLEVTAQKRVQSLQEVPIALTAYSGTFLENAGVTQLRDLAPFVPGLFIQEQSPNFPGINLRGITTDDNDPRTEARVSIFLDGVSTSRATASVSELFDLERVEVLKGPQGTLFGRSAEIGAISLIARKPVAARAAELTAGFGNLSSRRLSGYYNTPLGSEHLLGRVAFSTSHRDGNQANLVDGSDLNGRDTVAVRPSLRWQPHSGTTTDVVFTYQRDRPPGTGFKSGVIPTTRNDTNPFSAAELTRGSALGVDRTVWGATGSITHDLGKNWSLTTITAVRDYDSSERLDADGSRLRLLELTDDSAGHQFSQEVRLNLRGNDRLAGFLGASYFRERGNQHYGISTDERLFWPFFAADFRNGLAAAGVPAALLNFALPTASPFAAQASLPAGFALFNNSALPTSLRGLASLAGAPLKPEHNESYTTSATTQSTDLFADGTWRATPQLDLTAGARVSFEQGTTGYEAPRAPVPSTLGFLLGASPNLAVAPTAGRLTADVSDTAWVGRLAALYRVSSSLHLFADAAHGRRPPTVFINNSGLTPISEETVRHVEAGAKGTLGRGHFDYSASVFHYTYRHFQTTVRDPANAARFIVVDAGNATGRGAELNLRGRMSAAVGVFATYGYTDATFDATDGRGQAQRFAGSSFRLTARHSLSLGTSLDAKIGNVGSAHLTPVYQYRSRQYFDDDNTRFGGTLRQDGFGLVNLRGGWRSANRRWAVDVFVENAFDRNYLIDAGNFGANYNIPTFIRGEPRLFGASATVRF